MFLLKRTPKYNRICKLWWHQWNWANDLFGRFYTISSELVKIFSLYFVTNKTRSQKNNMTQITESQRLSETKQSPITQTNTHILTHHCQLQQNTRPSHLIIRLRTQPCVTETACRWLWVWRWENDSLREHFQSTLLYLERFFFQFYVPWDKIFRTEKQRVPARL